jgi:MFS family permease
VKPVPFRYRAVSPVRERSHPAKTPRAVIAGLLAADVAFAFQQTAVVPAIHSVEQSLGASREWSAWLITVYLIVATIATPAMGRLADLHGRRRMLLIGLGVFMAGSVGAALAPSTAVLLACRAVQGVGGSVYPLTLALARGLFRPERAGRVIAWSAGAFGLGTAAGFAGGGLLAQYASWRWIFVAGALLVAAGFGLVLALVPRTAESASGGYDWRGTTALAAAAIGLLVALTLVVPLGWASPVTAGLLVLAALAAVAWVRLEQKVPDPLIDVNALRTPAVLRANLATVGLGWALFGSYLLVPEFALAQPGTAHYGLGASTAAVGLIMLPLALGQTVAGPLAGAVSRRVSPRVVFAAGLGLTAAALAWLSVIRGGLPQTAGALLVLGAGAGTGLQSGSNVATQGVSADVAAASSSLNSTVRRFAGGVGGQVSTILLASYLVVTTGQPRFAAFTLAYLIAAVLCLAGAGAMLAGRGATAGGGPHQKTAPGARQPAPAGDRRTQPSAHAAIGAPVTVTTPSRR